MTFHLQKQYRPLRNQEEEKNPFDKKWTAEELPNVPGDYWTGLLLDKLICNDKPEKIVCRASLPNMHMEVCDRLFKRSLGTNREPLRHLFFKAFPPVRCWTRKWWTVLCRYTKPNPECKQCKKLNENNNNKNTRQQKCAFCQACIRTDRLVSRLILCTLLGNYPHIPDSAYRPDRATRTRLYKLLDSASPETYNSAESVEWREQLRERCPRVYLHAIQEFMCTEVESAPALRRHVSNLMQFTQFFALVKDTNDRTRKELANKKPDYTRLAARLEIARTQMLHFSCDKLHPPFLEFLREIRIKRKLASQWFANLPEEIKATHELARFRSENYVKPSSEISRRIGDVTKEEDEEDSESDEEKEPSPNLSRAEANPTSMSVLIEQAVQAGLQRALKREATCTASPGKIAIPITAMDITMDDSRVLEEFVNMTVDKSTSADQAFWNLTRVLPEFRVPSTAVARLQMMWVDYKLVKISKDRWKKRMNEFSQLFPYAYALIQAGRRFYARRKQLQTYPLPINVAEAQIRAIERIYGCLFYEACCFYYCPCCRNPASLTRSIHCPKLNKIEGLRGVVTDVKKREAYCSRSAILAHRQCGMPDQPLAAEFILGKWLSNKGKGSVLCCHCGQGTRIEDHNVYDEDGLACTQCSAKLQV